MGIPVGINGFGRIGRIALRIMLERGEKFELRGINLRKADLDYMEYMVKYDSVFRTFHGTVEHDGENLIVNGHKICVFSQSDAGEIPWSDCGAEYIIESTGAFNTQELGSLHLKGGAKKVVITAPAKDDVTPTFVMGVNHETYTPDMNVVSNASCTTNCLAPLTKVIQDNFGIEEALMSTIHASTAKQKAVDARPGLADGPLCDREHHSILHRRGQGGGAGHAGAEGEDDRDVLPHPHQRRIRGGSDRPPVYLHHL